MKRIQALLRGIFQRTLPGTFIVVFTVGYSPQQFPQTTITIRPAQLPVAANDLILNHTIEYHQDALHLHKLVKPQPAPQPVIASKQVVQQPAVQSPPPAPGELESWFQEYGNAFNINPDLLKSIAKCESGYRANAVNGPYGGMYQYLASTWSSTRNAMGADPNPDLRFDAKEAIFTTSWKISVGGIGAWPHCGKVAQANYPLLAR